MVRSAALALTLLLAGCGGGAFDRPGRVPGSINTERPEAMPANSYPFSPNSMPR